MLRFELAFIVAIAVCSSLSASKIVWLEAERFERYGGWVNDAQFIDQMGSPYLLANGIGEPVEDAATRVALPKPGKYRLWVRTKDWMPEHHPGRFQVLLNGQDTKRLFGASGRPGWRWEDGGVHELSSEIEVSLRDQTGFYGRCDVLVLNSDLDWTPPADVEGIAELREKHEGVSRKIKDMPARDVVVIGGGLAGCTAAVAAARNGASVALIQNRSMLGGNASPEILVPPVGVWPHMKRDPLDPRETGLVEEYRTEGNQRVSEGKLYGKRLMRFVSQEPNLHLHLNTHGVDVEMADGSKTAIAAVLAIDVNTGQRMRFPGLIFIDCTGDAVIGAAAGAEYRRGKEPKSMYAEPWAPERPSKHTMGNGLKYYHRDTGQPQPFEAPPWVHEFPGCDDFAPGRHPRLVRGNAVGYQWQIELGGMRDTIADAEEIRDDLLRLIYGLWDHTKNHCPKLRRETATHTLVWVGHVAGKRESRRLIGDYVLTMNDIGDQTLFPDRVAYGGWCTDDHYSEGFFYDGSFARHHDFDEHAYTGLPYSIPFRCLYSRNIANLMMAGRDISASHLALSNTRVMLTCAIIGHAVGTGAAMCLEKDTTPRGVCREHIQALQQRLLKEGAHIIGLRANDPRDLARKASLAASSEGTVKGERMAAANVTNGFDRAEGGKTNAWIPDPDAAGPHWIELSWDAPVTLNMVHVIFQTARLTPKQFRIQARTETAWRTVAEVDRNRHRRHVLGLDRITTAKLRLVLAEPVGVCGVRVYDEPRRLVDVARRAHRTMRLPDKGPWLPWSEGKPAKTFRGIVLDAAEADRVGEWAHSTWAEPFVGDGYLHDGNSEKGKKAIRFALQVRAPGRYEIRLAYVPHTNRASNTPVTIRFAGGEKTLRIDQRSKPPIGGLFVSLGTYKLDRQSTVTVVNDDTNGYVIVDALQLIARDDAEKIRGD